MSYLKGIYTYIYGPFRQLSHIIPRASRAQPDTHDLDDSHKGRLFILVCMNWLAKISLRLGQW